MKSGELRMEQVLDRQVLIGRGGDGAQVVYRHEPSLPKPAIHPLVTPAGVTISGFEMSDHVWHRGLWFTIKFANGENFWEEVAPFGRQVGVAQPRVEVRAEGTVTLRHELAWRSESSGEVLQERRRVRCAMQEGIPALDWETTLTAVKDVTLDRTPFTTWGGYGGLAFRASRELHEAKFHVPGAEPAASLAGAAHPWCLLGARVDGGRDRHVWIGMVDHPDNPRRPSPWYCKSGNGFTYMNPAFLFNEPMQLAAQESLTLRYRVAWGDGPADPSSFEQLATAYQQRTERGA